jgi:subtilase family serine protease
MGNLNHTFLEVLVKALTPLLLSMAIIGVHATALVAQGYSPQGGTVVVPDSTLERPQDIGLRAHTNHLILLSPELTGASPGGETPGSLACIYGTVVSPTAPGCPISTSTTVPSGGSGVIAIVDAFDYPTAANDFDVFSTQFGLPLSADDVCNGTNPCFKKVFATGTQPRKNCGWAQEAALDIEWAHAMAPHAQIVLVEAASNSFSDLFQAVDVASNEVLCGDVTCISGSGSGEVSMSWGGKEFSSESGSDSHFMANGVVYFAASGDTGAATIYPGVSPNVVCAGGTTINRDRDHNFTSETGWSGSGGGPSKYESRPPYQDGIMSIVGTQRGAPDFSLDSDPNSGVSVYDSTPCQGLSGWLVFGGTSVATQALAGIVNLAGHFYPNTGSGDGELDTIYGCYATPSCYSSDFRDIVSGTAGNRRKSFSATTGWDFVTGVGSDQGLNSK